MMWLSVSRLFSFWCCLRIFFKSSRQQLGGAGRWESNGISSTTPESQRQGSVQKLVPRRACLGTRYILLLAMILISSAVLGLGIYALVELHSLLSQLGCATGQAASTIINGQTFNNPPGASRLPTTNSPSFTAFSAPSPFGEVEFPILQTGSLSRSLATRSGLDFVAAPFAFPKATGDPKLPTSLLQAELKPGGRGCLAIFLLFVQTNSPSDYCKRNLPIWTTRKAFPKEQGSSGLRLCLSSKQCRCPRP